MFFFCVCVCIFTCWTYQSTNPEPKSNDLVYLSNPSDPKRLYQTFPFHSWRQRHGVFSALNRGMFQHWTSLFCSLELEYEKCQTKKKNALKDVLKIRLLFFNTCGRVIRDNPRNQEAGELKGEVVVPFLSTLLYVSHFFLGGISPKIKDYKSYILLGGLMLLMTWKWLAGG